MTGRTYDTHRWEQARDRALERDGRRCTVGWLLGGTCHHELHVHHLVPLAEGGDEYALDNLATVCAAHHPQWESLRRQLRRQRGETWRRCRHRHVTAESRRLCEERLNGVAA